MTANVPTSHPPTRWLLAFPMSVIAMLMAMFIAVALSACGGDDSSSEPSTGTTTPTDAAPVITTDAAALTVMVGTDASFTVVASGNALSYQWQNSTDGGNTWADIAGAVTSTLVLSAVPDTDDGLQVRVVVTNDGGSATGQGALLSVVAAPSITTPPASVAVVAPDPASFSITATGLPAPTITWQRSDDGGATFADVGTGTSYTLSSTALTDNLAQFHAVVTNSAGTVTSDPVVLTVTAATIAPSITTQPLPVTVTAPGTATFTVAATGTPTPAIQWQSSVDGGVSFVDIAGATSASYTTPGTVVSQNGMLYRAVATSSAGTATSAGALLTVNAPAVVSTLQGRAWATGQSLETDDNAVKEVFSDIDDTGHSMVIFKKTDGTRDVLYATLGTPNAAGTAPTWSAPVAIDVLNGVALTATTSNSGFASYAMASAPNGNVAVVWIHKDACTSSTYWLSGTCGYLYVARYTASSGTWEAPVLIGDTPGGTYGVHIDSAGDIALRMTAWVRDPNGGGGNYFAYTALAWRGAGQSGFTQRVFSDVTLGSFDYAMDDSGDLIVAGEAKQNATTDLVAYRGNVTNGLNPQEVLDTRGSAAVFYRLSMGLHGNIAVLWQQNNGTANTIYGAAAATATGTFTATDLGFNSSLVYAVATDDGGAIAYAIDDLFFVRWSGSAGWSAAQNFPSNAASISTFLVYGFARNGNFIAMSESPYGNLGPNQGIFATYDATQNTLIQPFVKTTPGSGYVLGVANSAGYSPPHLSVSGIAAVTMFNEYDTLPSPTLPNGDGRSVVNLWGAFLK